MDEILSRGKLPIIVGGTNYYIEGLMFEKCLQNSEEEDLLDFSDYDPVTFKASFDQLKQIIPLDFHPLLDAFET